MSNFTDSDNLSSVVLECSGCLNRIVVVAVSVRGGEDDQYSLSVGSVTFVGVEQGRCRLDGSFDVRAVISL